MNSRKFFISVLFLHSYRTSVNALLEAEISNHESSFDPDNIRDFIDAYLLKMSQTTDKDSSFYGDLGKLNMRNSMFDLFIAGMDTTATTLRLKSNRILKKAFPVRFVFLTELQLSVIFGK